MNEQNLLEYLNFPKVVACGGSWMVDQKAIAAKDWAKIDGVDPQRRYADAGVGA